MVLSAVLLLSGCDLPLIAAPTATPTFTASPTLTPTATATLTPTPTQTQTVTPVPTVITRYSVREGGFSVEVPAGYEVQADDVQVFISDVAGTLIITLVGVESSDTPEAILAEFLTGLEERVEGEFIQGDSEPIHIGGFDGEAYALSGTLFGSPLVGKTFVIQTGTNRFLFALGISNTGADSNRWENHGSNIFESILATIEFEEAPGAGTCPIATDDTYGYTEANAIRVGGDFLDGPARERAYLDNLRGPNGEVLTYERQGSLTAGDVILDAYSIFGLPTDVTLYIDMYTYEELQAPVGLTCNGPFISRP